MSDNSTTVEEMRQWMRQFVAERQWEQFHSPKNLSMSLSIEAAELMEHFQWIDVEASRQVQSNPQKMQEIGEEIADVLSYTLALANSLGIDLSETLRQKMVKNRLKYPAEKFQGRYGHNDQLRKDANS
ncbi:MAG: nucleotide pyrophosphohydrolase [Planctomycetaceae bacterium]